MIAFTASMAAQQEEHHPAVQEEHPERIGVEASAARELDTWTLDYTPSKQLPVGIGLSALRFSEYGSFAAPELFFRIPLASNLQKGWESAVMPFVGPAFRLDGSENRFAGALLGITTKVHTHNFTAHSRIQRLQLKDGETSLTIGEPAWELLRKVPGVRWLRGGAENVFLCATSCAIGLDPKVFAGWQGERFSFGAGPSYLFTLRHATEAEIPTEHSPEPPTRHRGEWKIVAVFTATW